MFPSSKIDNPFDFLLKRSSFLCDQQNPSSKLQDESVPFFLNFPSPFFDEHEMPLNQILSQSQIMAANHHHHHHAVDQIENHNTVTKPSIAASKSKGKEADQGIDPNGINLTPPRRRNTSGLPRKRTGKKDRHSKICTAQGIRDRRMRLSLQIARKFFDLQDMLGFDKASKTIEWLFTKSKKAIKELEKDHPHISTSEARSESFLSECEVMSGLGEISNNDVKEGMVIAPAKNITGPSCLNPSEETDKRSKKRECNSNMRESRNKARARARSRTREKMMIKRRNKSNPNHENEDVLKLESLTSSCPFEGVDQESRSHDQENTVSPFIPDFNSIGEQLLTDEGTIEKLLGNSRTPRYCPISDYNHCSDSVAGCLDSNSHFMGFLGNWDLFTADKITPSPSQHSATNHVPFAGNPISIYSATAPNFQAFHQ